MQARRREQLRARLHPRPRVLVVTAVEAERTAVLRGLGLPPDDPRAALDRGDRIVVAAGGVGPASAAATAAWLLAVPVARDPFDVVVCAGVAGGFAGPGPGRRDRAGRPQRRGRPGRGDAGRVPAPGRASSFGPSTLEVDAVLSGPSARGAARRRGRRRADGQHRHRYGRTRPTRCWPGGPTRWPRRWRASAWRAPPSWPGPRSLELRTISNPVGPRDRAAWRLDEALAALERSVAGLASLEP